jgi:hypothetical protein
VREQEWGQSMGTKGIGDESTWEQALDALELNGRSLIDWVRVDAEELAGTEQLQARLQMAMDRMSKMMATMSKLLAKASETSQEVIRNIK